MLNPHNPAIILAPMQGLTDSPMRALQGEIGAFTFAVSEFVRISAEVLSKRPLYRHVPELRDRGLTSSGLPVQVQLLGGHPGRMAQSALVACECGAKAIDINFGCPAPTVNRHDGGATLLKYPRRIREIVKAVRDAVPPGIPVSAKLRLGWDSSDSIFENAEMAAEGGAAWLTIHGRTREQRYDPPALWHPIRIVRERLGIPTVANGDIWSIEEFRRCYEETGCTHYMLGRGALANPRLSHQIARELGLFANGRVTTHDTGIDWPPYLRGLIRHMENAHGESTRHSVCRLKQWLNLARLYGSFTEFGLIKHARSVDEIFAILGEDRDEGRGTRDEG